MRIAVLMTCFNRVETTLICLRRLFDQVLPKDCSLEVWLVDDASPDKTGEKVKTAFPQVNVIQGRGNLFWCKGMRLAWDKAAEAYDYDFYLWLNDDVGLYEGSIGTALKDYSSVEKESVVYGTFVENESSEELTYGCSLVQDSCTPVRPNGAPQKVEGQTTGNFVLVPKCVYQKVGKIYDGFSHGVADTDYGLLLAENGCNKYVASKVIGWCKANRADSSEKLKKMGLLNRIKLLWSPRGRNVKDTFILRYRHWGLMRAIVSSLHVIIMVVLARSCRSER